MDKEIMQEEKLRKIAEMAIRGTIHERKVAKKILLKHGISDPELYLQPPTRYPNHKTLDHTIDKFVLDMETMTVDAIESTLSRIADRFRCILRKI
jgi:hypothetical protein